MKKPTNLPEALEIDGTGLSLRMNNCGVGGGGECLKDIWIVGAISPKTSNTDVGVSSATDFQVRNSGRNRLGSNERKLENDSWV